MFAKCQGVAGSLLGGSGWGGGGGLEFSNQ